MESLDLATKLLRGGMDIRDAADVLLWMAACWKYNGVDALVQLEDIAQTLDNEELWVPQPWLEELHHLRQKVKVCQG